ncbi:NUDIX hydrolase [Bifidobacterium aemilianum]|nr:NUDIX hydrolase [Bifidobacterium aemilianum]
MTTPADLARMIANVADRHTQKPAEPDQLFYSSQSTVIATHAIHLSAVDQRQKAPEAAGDSAQEPEETGGTRESKETKVSNGSQPGDSQQELPQAQGGKPTPALMPRHRQENGPTSFASLEAQDLPVVREYSAGGLIFNDQRQVAIIARRSRSGHIEWCLPKGHIEEGETPEQTAVREVHEETGILGEVVDSIATIDYWFTGTEQRVHKLVQHFVLRQTGGWLTVEGDPDHEAEEATWVDFDDLDQVLSYPNERKIVWLYTKKKDEQAQP